MTDKLVGRGGFIGVGAVTAPVPAEQPNFAGLNNETDYTCLVDCGNGYYVRVFAFKRQNRFTFSLLSTTKTPRREIKVLSVA